MHNYLKSNNVLLDKQGSRFAPVIIDFGKSREVFQAKPAKDLKKSLQSSFKRKFPHIAPEIVEGRGGQSMASDVYSLTIIAENIYSKYKFGQLPALLLKCLSALAEKRPSCTDIIELFKEY